ncbi:hypothetical protein [Prevotella sp. kh1p2]|uniref:hypothetical protein n=1 Tax=Prevotella sp. kh1p2 TaxID=1761883 RepID=UPI0008B9EC0B|nr:hypothetical protein [Prevotella sp. kh1p2]SET15564.1 hypothetical protein SAMN04487825_1174 [Prevotella sp. kh1p2]SNU12120.1 hypothetical protein SAMN06298210_11845 [Prevotellaceae bacterium KH2P17]
MVAHTTPLCAIFQPLDEAPPHVYFAPTKGAEERDGELATGVERWCDKCRIHVRHLSKVPEGIIRHPLRTLLLPAAQPSATRCIVFYYPLRSLLPTLLILLRSAAAPAAGSCKPGAEGLKEEKKGVLVAASKLITYFCTYLKDTHGNVIYPTMQPDF